MTTPTTTRHRYTGAEMHIIIGYAKRGALIDTLLAAWSPFGVDLTDQHGPKIKVSDYSIPEDQWKTICDALCEARDRDGGLVAANLAMDWMNLGPSSHDDDPPPPDDELEVRFGTCSYCDEPAVADIVGSDVAVRACSGHIDRMNRMERP